MKSTSNPKIQAVVQCMAAALLLWGAKAMAMPLLVQYGHSPLLGMQGVALAIKGAVFAVPMCFLKMTQQPCTRPLPQKLHWRWIGLVFPMMAAMALVSFGVEAVQGWLGIQRRVGSLSKPQSVTELVLWVASMAVLPAIAEEWIFRKEIQSRLLLVGRKKALLLAALLFASVHSDGAQIASALIGGLFLGGAALVWGVREAVLLHLVNNLSALVLPWLGSRAAAVFWAACAAAALFCVADRIWKKERVSLDGL